MNAPARIPVEVMAARLRALRPTMTASDEALLETYWRFHPRFRFLKTVAPAAALLDIGAGSGGLAHWKTWLEPVRTDIAMYGADLRRGENSGLYQAWEVADLDRAMPNFPGVTFDAFILSHVVEHLRDPAGLMRWIARRINPGGRVYVEWPSEHSAVQPAREAFLAHGIDIQITNFFDDATHVRIVPMEEIAGAAVGFEVVASGLIDHGAVGQEMLARGLAGGDGFAKLAGYWSISLWSRWMELIWRGP